MYIVPKKIDYLIAAALAAIVIVAGFVWANPAPHPQVWCDYATAAGLRVPVSPFPVLWRLLAKGIFAVFGINGGIAVMGVLGKLALGLATALVYAIVWNIALGFHINENDSLMSKNFRLAAVVGALSFAFSEPAWRAAQDFSSEMLFVILLLLAMILTLRMMLLSEFKPAVPSVFLAGALTAESPLGIVVLGAFLCTYWFFGGSLSWDKPDALSHHARINRKWKLLFSGLFGFGLVVSSALLMFILSDGADAHGLHGNICQWAHYFLTDWWLRLASGVTLLGWLAIIGVAFLPGIVALWNVHFALDGESDVGFGVGVLHLLAGILALSQLSGYAPFWAANWGVAPIVTSPLVLLMSVAFGGVVVGVAFSTWGINRAIYEQRGAGYLVLIVLVVVACVAGRFPGSVRQGLRAIDDFLELTLKESKDSNWLITDGNFDDALRLKLAAAKSPLKLASYMASGKDRTQLSALLKTEGDELAAGEGVPSLLNTWVRQNRDEGVAAELGFECWKRNLKIVPPAGGIMVRAWPNETERHAAIAAAKTQGERLMAVAADSPRDRVVSHYVELALWRLARIAAQRAEQAALRGDDALAATETKLVEDLDNANESAVRFRKKLREANSRMRISSPAETMKQAVDRGDFGLASVYAKRLVKENPKYARAYFALGMYEVSIGEFVKAEVHFNKYLEIVPEDPVVLNNRAMARMSMGKYQEALVDAEAALRRLPKVPEVQRTVESIRKAMAIAATNSVPPSAKQ